ncbi:hypothetical protein CBP51_03265 [Cellvibrio mixtus]|uniref:Peptidase C14 caspase domain-containing protein n=1 Tax=Cellvibrio mixtus TaxID=39650 RepID=A0A266Q8A4_9GAMM|nr:caspase family protein [Cellvibrio mixtus]OZY86065.1 hypothetical protein CBP51_03265 [Cellvibrio mixtus]
MTVIFESEAYKQNTNIAATHVLIIGCGEYPNLTMQEFGGLKSLTAPSISAKAIADWFLSGEDAMPIGKGLQSHEAFCNPAAPLGTLTIFMSPKNSYETPWGAVISTARPTIANIRIAYLEWLNRLAENNENRGVFYFCGHGVSNGINQYLLADDFGDDPSDLFASAFHVSNTIHASIRKTSASLFFFIDACMEFNEDLVQQIDEPKSLYNGPRKGVPKTRNWAVIRATTTNRLAYAPKNGVARFTDSLLCALKGHCGTQQAMGSNFEVCATHLRDAIADFLVFSQRSISGDQQVLGEANIEGNGKIAMHVLKQRPLVLLELDVDPEGYRPIARAFTENNLIGRDTRSLSNGPARFLMHQGEWTYGTNALNNEYVEQITQGFFTGAALSCCFKVP